MEVKSRSLCWRTLKLRFFIFSCMRETVRAQTDPLHFLSSHWNTFLRRQSIYMSLKNCIDKSYVNASVWLLLMYYINIHCKSNFIWFGIDIKISSDIGEYILSLQNLGKGRKRPQIPFLPISVLVMCRVSTTGFHCVDTGDKVDDEEAS